MPSMRLKGLMLLSILMPTLQACALFAGAPPIVTSRAACSSLIPDTWRDGVPGADLPDGEGGETVGDWIAFADAQTAQLDKANGRTRDTLGIIERCEARDRTAVKSAS